MVCLNTFHKWWFTHWITTCFRWPFVPCQTLMLDDDLRKFIVYSFHSLTICRLNINKDQNVIAIIVNYFSDSSFHAAAFVFNKSATAQKDRWTQWFSSVARNFVGGDANFRFKFFDSHLNRAHGSSNSILINSIDGWFYCRKIGSAFFIDGTIWTICSTNTFS